MQADGRDIEVAAIFILCVMGMFCLFSAIAGTSLDIKAITVEDTAESLAALKSTTISTSELVLVTNGLTYILSIFCILLFLAALTEVWMFTVVLGCYFYLREKSFAKTCESGRITQNFLKGNKTPNNRAGNYKDIDVKEPPGPELNSRNFIKTAETDC
ncbi:unnamed protein product [Enterobius vermicularis]|uniref:Uncharacterized protein n=1 Tax=Enterobius vermicularis TaxID=51028 RepID=A0A0N4V1N8_ENTVE|nr:unnamed protein product [Enterobius vermicularis]